MPPGTILQLLVGIVALALLWTTWWLNNNDKKTKEKDALDKEIQDAIASGDVSRINNVIQRLRKGK